MMMIVVSFAVFAGALGAASFAIAITVGSRADRILAALRGQSLVQAQPLAALVRAEQRIAVRRWAAERRPVATSRMRAAA